MKKQFFYLLGLVIVMFASSCSKSDTTTTPTPITPTPPPVVFNPNIRGIITTNTTLKKENVYVLRGYVYVATGVTLTIEAGTKITSNKDSAGVLVVYRGAKIIAEGTAAAPIVFTSGESTPVSGDLGGLIIVGQAPGNGNHSVVEGGVDAAFSAFGGTDKADNSGILKYVRIEYAGKAVNPGDEVNGLSLYGVGSGTTIDYVQVTRGYDDAFEIFGGTVNLKHLIAYNSADDDFDFDDGYSGKIQFAISVKDPKFTDPKGTTGDVSNNFEVDNVNPANGFTLARPPISFPVMSNFTAVGPNTAPGAAPSNGAIGTGTSSDYGWGMRWRRGTKFILANSVVIGGAKGGLRIQEDSTISYLLNGISGFYNSYVHTVANSAVEIDKVYTLATAVTFDAAKILSLITGTNKSTVVTDLTTLKLADAFNNAAPNLIPGAGSPLLTGALFDFGATSDSFFEKVAYKGAFDGTTDWTKGWAAWGK